MLGRYVLLSAAFHIIVFVFCFVFFLSYALCVCFSPVFVCPVLHRCGERRADERNARIPANAEPVPKHTDGQTKTNVFYLINKLNSVLINMNCVARLRLYSSSIQFNSCGAHFHLWPAGTLTNEMEFRINLTCMELLHSILVPGLALDVCVIVCVTWRKWDTMCSDALRSARAEQIIFDICLMLVWI